MKTQRYYFLPDWGKYFEPKEKEGKWTLFEFKHELGFVHYQFIIRPISLPAGDVTYYDIIMPFGFSG